LRKTDARHDLGTQGEDRACTMLTEKGFIILARNYRIFQGEIDIVAQKAEVVAFVEVKARRTDYFPLTQVITRSKQQKLVRAAKSFITKNKLYDKACRFDVVTLTMPHNGEIIIQHIENAFYG
jgi:putative endonuclease